MSEYCQFCEDCPVRGEVKGPVTGAYGGGSEVVVKYFGGVVSAHLGYGLVIPRDDAGNIALPIKVPIDLTQSEIGSMFLQKLQACDGPVTRMKGIFKKRHVPVECHSFPNGVIDRSDIGQRLSERTRRMIALEAIRPQVERS